MESIASTKKFFNYRNIVFDKKKMPNKMSQLKKNVVVWASFFLLLVVIFLVWIWNISYAEYFDEATSKLAFFSIEESLKLIFTSQFLQLKKEYINLQQTVYVSTASILSGIALAFAGCITQSLTRNPLADASTLGIVHASVFMVVLAFSRGLITEAQLYGFAFIGGIISAVMLFALVFGGRNKVGYIKMTLAGLAIGVFFNTITYYIRVEDGYSAKINLLFVFGGAENIIKAYEYTDFFRILWISTILIAIGVITSIIISHKLTIIEVGDDKAKNLGTNVITIKVVSIIATMFLIPPAILLVGNVAFVGLFAPHIIRKVFSIRDYRLVMPLSAALGAIITSVGVVLFRETTYINSSIWMTIIGAPVLAYVGWIHWEKR
ncbi:FecCD family ABC transporter permease [Ureaplasma canigenitalium]|uniref:FecCD family ABC transporter permease n=1 Tax=Ureaplasma canigenitalium TaxID=42092 RepID=UPI0004E26731|nr:iron ABC transporter permease [Ureaplasma canigenitalium]